jgi:hypothetical protein|tara:strand:+ start:7340 stop:7636 length:297 start_codon:yes stop_codon:yes gene_type:complete
MSRGLVQPLFPNPPEGYDQRYQAEVLRAFSVFLQQVSNPGPWQASALTLPNLQTDNYSLPLGGIFQYGDELRITVANMPYARGSQATGAVGQATVTIS